MMMDPRLIRLAVVRRVVSFQSNSISCEPWGMLIVKLPLSPLGKEFISSPFKLVCHPGK